MPNNKIKYKETKKETLDDLRTEYKSIISGDNLDIIGNVDLRRFINVNRIMSSYQYRGVRKNINALSKSFSTYLKYMVKYYCVCSKKK